MLAMGADWPVAWLFVGWRRLLVRAEGVNPTVIHRPVAGE